jgi:PAS domain S-box-containing protein
MSTRSTRSTRDDIHEQLRESEDRFRSLAQNAVEPIITIDTHDHIIFANRAAEVVFGYSGEELLGIPFSSLIPERLRRRHHAAIERYLRTGKRNIPWDGIELPGLRRDGTEVLLEITFGEFVSGGRRFFTGIMRDVTQRKRMDEERRLLLERERVARAEAEAANRAKSEFLATMSHEIRTPINAVIGYASLLGEEINGPLNEAQSVQLERIKASSRHLLALIDDILDLAKVEAGRMKIQYERCEVGHAVTDALSLIRKQAEDRELELRNQCVEQTKLAFIGDSDRVRQILVNLLTNATKFTAPGGAITVQCGATRAPRDRAVLVGVGPWTYIRIEDTGIGISPRDQERIFRPFVQAEAGLTRTRGGTGLGLTISRELARMMDGDLTVESTPGVGSSFTLWLPQDGQPPIPTHEILSETYGRGQKARGLAIVGQTIQQNLNNILEEYADRLQHDPLIPEAVGLGLADLEDHASTFLTEIGEALVILETSKADPVNLMRDGTEIQRVISELHGAQRARLGWTEEALHREWTILWESLEKSVRMSPVQDATIDLAPGLAALRRMITYAEQISRLGLRRAVAESAAHAAEYRSA